MDKLEPGQLSPLILQGLGYLLVLLAYVSGARIMRLLRVNDWNARSGQPMPLNLQWHVTWGLLAGLSLLLGDLFALSGVGGGGPVQLAVLAATFLVVLSGVARVYMGGSGRLHLLAVIAAFAAFAAGAVALLRQLAAVL